jgi:hypothetical protein
VTDELLDATLIANVRPARRLSHHDAVARISGRAAHSRHVRFDGRGRDRFRRRTRPRRIGEDRGVHALKRVIEPEDIAGAIMVCVAALKLSTGTKIVVDGGRFLV